MAGGGEKWRDLVLQDEKSSEDWLRSNISVIALLNCTCKNG